MECIDYNLVCRVCLEEGVFRIDDTTFKLNDMDVELSVAFRQFSTLQIEDTSYMEESSSLLCEVCVHSLLKAYEFLQKVHKSDELYQNLQMKYAMNVESESPHQTESLKPDDENIEIIYIHEEEDDRDEDEITKSTEYFETIPKRLAYEESEEIIDTSGYLETEEEMKHDSVPRQSDNKKTNSTYIALAHYSIVDFHKDNDHLSETECTGKSVKTIEISARQITVESIELALKFPKASADASMYACQYCPKAFSTPYHLINHTKKAHLCQFCLERFQKLNDLHLHVKVMHKRFDCSFCDKGFFSNTNLRSHLKRAHDINLPAYVSLLTIKTN